MAISLVQSAHNTADSVTSITVTLGSNTGTGNCLVVYVNTIETTTSPTVSGITLGGSADHFALAKRSNAAGTCNSEIWTDQNAASGQTSVVVTLTGGSGLGKGTTVVVEEWSGIATSGAVDVTNGQSVTTASASWSSLSSGTLAQANELVVGTVGAFIGASGIITINGPSSPWTNTASLNDTAQGVQSITGHEVVSATTAQTYNGTFTGSNETYSAVIVALKGTSGIVVNLPVLQKTQSLFPLKPPLYVNLPVFARTQNLFSFGSLILPLRLLVYSITELANNSPDPEFGNSVLQGAAAYLRSFPTIGLQVTPTGFTKWIAPSPTGTFVPAITPSAYSSVMAGDTTQFTVNTSGVHPVSIGWQVTADDSGTNSVYQVEVFGNGTQDASGTPQLILAATINGTVVNLTSGFTIAGSAGFSYRARFVAILNGDNAYTFMEGTVNGIPFTDYALSATAWNPQVLNTIQMVATWSGFTGTPSVSGNMSIFTRGGN